MRAQFARFLTPCSWGSEITQIAITRDRFERLSRPFGHILWYVFATDSHLSRATVFRSPPSGDLDVFLALLGSHTWRIHFCRLAPFSHVL